MAYDFSGLFVELTIEEMAPVAISLESDGGIVQLFKFQLSFELSPNYSLTYMTNDRKIKLTIPLTSDEYFHNLDFFGGNWVEYSSSTIFKLDGKKFKL